MRTRVILASLPLLLWGSATNAETADSLRTYALQGITVTSSATATTPVAYTNLNAAQTSRSYFAQDLPFLLTGTPSLVATSDAGNGTGYTYLRIRGTDATRINVTTNGVPMNDPESHSLYWVNSPDLVQSMSSIQIQRGAGTSTNGAGAFGGSINMKTDDSCNEPYGSVTAAYGSFNTHRETLKLGTGLIKGHWNMSARLSNIGSDGYTDRAASRLQSYMAQAAYFSDKTSVRLISFGGKERTYMSWNGVAATDWKKSPTYNSCGEIKDAAGNVTGYYPNQYDNYAQINNQLLIQQRLTKEWKLNVTAHYTRGDGYYEEYKNARTLSEYGLAPYDLNGSTVKKSNLVRKKAMWNNFGGIIASASYNARNISAAFGAAWNIYDGSHFGQVLWVQNYIGTLDTEHEYYRNHSTKNDANIFAKADWAVARGVNLYADLQYRFINHRINGRNDNYDWIKGEMQALDVNRTYHFFNPKLGVNYAITDNHTLYASLAVVSKEPTRNGFTDAKQGVIPKAENMLDVEVGYKLSTAQVQAEANFYFMGYRNQLVQTGEINEIGEPLTANVPKSYRTGIELSASYQPCKWFRAKLYGTFSRNKILDYTEYTTDYDASWNELGTQTATVLGTTNLALSPSVIAGSVFEFNVRGLYAALNTQYVSRQYLTNGSHSELTLPHYCITNLTLRYTLPLRKLRAIDFGVAVNNLFNTRYASNGYGGSSTVAGARYDEAYYFPQAGINLMGSITIRF